MTKFICLSIDISHLSDSARRLAPEDIGNVGSLSDQQSITRPSGGLHSDVSVYLDIPAYLAVDKEEYGTSVYAAGRVGVEFARAELARAGIRKEELDQLGTAHVSIRKVSITYLFKFSTPVEASTFSAALYHHALLLRLGIHHDRSVNTVEFRDRARPNGVDAAGQSPDETVLTKHSQPDRKLVRLELEVGGSFLSRRGWTTLESWRTAYAEKRYELIFNDNVRRLFRLDTSLQYDEPDKWVYDRLSPQMGRLLREYVGGKDIVTACVWFPPPGVMSEGARKRKLKEYRDSILDVCGIDVRVPWRTHRQMRQALLDSKLRYPDDFQPEFGHAASLFCRQSWPMLLKTLREEYEEALSAAEKQVSLVLSESR